MELTFPEVCRSCPLALRKGLIAPVPPKYHRNSPLKFLFIGGAPGKNEEDLGEPFIGKSGQLLRNQITKAELSLDDCLFSNACLCAPKDRMGKIITPQADEYDHCIVHSLNLIRRYKPKMVMVVGGISMLAVLKPRATTKVTTVHGRIFEMNLTVRDRYLVLRSWFEDFKGQLPNLDMTTFSVVNDEEGMLFQIDRAKSFGYSEDWTMIPVMPLVHPDFALRTGEEGQWAESILFDLQAAAMKVIDTYATKPENIDYKWINTVAEFREYADFLIREFKAGNIGPVACDVETSEEVGESGNIGLLSLNPIVRILTIQFSHATNQGVSVFVNHRESAFNLPDAFAQLRTILCDIFENVDIVGHNFQFDAKAIRCRFGIKKFRLVGDTMLMSHWLNAGKGMSGKLDELGARLLGTGRHKRDSQDWRLQNPTGTYEEMPLQIALEYGCGDTDVTRQCYDILKESIEDDNRWTEYFDHHHGVHGVWEVICDLEWAGMPINKTTLDHLAVIYPQMIDECLKSIHRNPFVLQVLEWDRLEYNVEVEKHNLFVMEHNSSIIPKSRKRAKKYKNPVESLQEWLKNIKNWFNPGSWQQIHVLWKKSIKFNWAEIHGLEYNDVDSKKNPDKVGEYPSTDEANRKVLIEYLEGKIEQEESSASPNPQTLSYWKCIAELMQNHNLYKQLSKSNGTYVQGIYPLIIDKPGPEDDLDPNKRCYHLYRPYADFPSPWSIHPSYNLAKAETGRLTSSDPNGQNFPSSEKIRRNANVKNPYVSRWSRRGGLILQPDYSQIEVRVLVMLSDEKSMADAINRGEDVHRFVGSIVHRCKPEEVTSSQRKKIKAITFGIIYGQTVPSTAQKLGITIDEAQSIQDQLFARLPNLKVFMDQRHQEVRETKRVCIPTGRVCYLPHIGPDYSIGENNKALRNSVNAPLQGAASDLCAESFGRTWRRLQVQRLDSYPFSIIHDSQSFDCGPGLFFDILELQYYEMVWAPYSFFHWINVKPLAEFSLGATWGGLVDLELDFEGIEFHHNLVTLKGYKEDVEATTEEIKLGGLLGEILHDSASKDEEEAKKGKWERKISLLRENPKYFCIDKKLHLVTGKWDPAVSVMDQMSNLSILSPTAEGKYTGP